MEWLLYGETQHLLAVYGYWAVAGVVALDGGIHGYRQNWAICLSSAESGIAVASEGDSAQTLAWNHCIRGWALSHLGHRDEGLEELVAGIESSKRMWGQVFMSQLSTLIAVVLLLGDDVETAEGWLSQGFEQANRNSEHFFDIGFRPSACSGGGSAMRRWCSSGAQPKSRGSKRQPCSNCAWGLRLPNLMSQNREAYSSPCSRAFRSRNILEAGRLAREYSSAVSAVLVSS